ncbi:MAG: hypothetical protein Q9186_001471 [Xanthomendoza sp. 1 TL-2023]
MVVGLFVGLVGMLATGVTASPTNIKRQNPQPPPTDVFLFRSDLREGDGQSPEFKNLLLSVNGAGSQITFVPMDQRDNAAGGSVAGTAGVTLTGNSTGTPVVRNMVLGYNEGNPSAPQPVSLADSSNNVGEFTLVQGELRVTSGSTDPLWDSWLICPGPSLSWLAQVPQPGRGLVVTKPPPEQGCYIVRLFAERLEAVGNGLPGGNPQRKTGGNGAEGQTGGSGGTAMNAANGADGQTTGSSGTAMNAANGVDGQTSGSSGTAGNATNPAGTTGNSTDTATGGNGAAGTPAQPGQVDTIGSDVCGNGGCRSLEEYCAAVKRNGQTDEQCQ